MKKSWVDRLAGSDWGRAAMLVTAGGVAFVVLGAALPNWLAQSGDNSEYWISPNLEIYVGVVAIAVGIAWAAVVLALQNGRGRRRR